MSKKTRPKIYKQWERPEVEKIKDYGPSLTDQSMSDSTDINNILKRYAKTGILSAMIQKNPQYGDFSEPIEFQQALNKINLAHEQFNALDAKLRERFNNDPKKFLEFVSNKENKDEAIKLGIIPKPQDPPKEPTAPSLNPQS